MTTAGDRSFALALFRQWVAEAVDSGVVEPTAMALATANKAGFPAARMVLLKQADDRGFVFYTNLGSRKAFDITENPYAALMFFWPELDREVQIVGRVEPVDATEADNYFASRPVLSRIGAWASRQSRPLPIRFLLLCRIIRFAVIWALGRLTRPAFWSGFRVVPEEIRFRSKDDIQIFSSLAIS